VSDICQACSSLSDNRQACSSLSDGTTASAVLPPQLEEELQSDLRWQFLVKSILYTGRSKFQDVELLDSGPFGKARQASDACRPLCAMAVFQAAF